MKRDLIKDEIDLQLLDMSLGLPEPCECDDPHPERSAARAITICASCGGLIETDQERYEK